MMKEQIGEDGVSVVYVEKSAAKQVKNRLEYDKCLNRDFRIAQTKEDCIVAIPITSTKSYQQEIQHTFNDSGNSGKIIIIIHGFGTEFCLYSTAFLGNKNKIRRTRKDQVSEDELDVENNKLLKHQQDLTLVQSALLNTISQSLKERGIGLQDGDDEEIIIQKIQTLPIETCPIKVEILGDDRTVVVPLRSLRDDDNYIVTLLERYNVSTIESKQSFFELLWQNIAFLYQSSRIVRRGEVDPNSKIRKTGYNILWQVQSDLHSHNENSNIINMKKRTLLLPTSSWITVTEQGIRQSFDLSKVMFSRGNITEKIRFGKILVQTGERVLDLYAGIGYFTLPALIHGNAEHVVCCEWNQDAVESLRFNLKDNKVDCNATIIEGDCRTLFDKYPEWIGTFDRVSLGLLPSSEGGWNTAIQAIYNNPQGGGWLHIHGNVPVKEMRPWSIWVAWRLRKHLLEIEKQKNHHRNVNTNDLIVLVTHVEKVKSFAPNVNHYVADVFVGSVDLWHNTRLNHDHHMVEPGFTGVFIDEKTVACGDHVQVPSCALSENGVLHQAWMRR